MQRIAIRNAQVAKVLGIMVSCFPGIDYASLLFYRGLENKKIDALK
jgi:hypothetical protein